MDILAWLLSGVRPPGHHQVLQPIVEPQLPAGVDLADPSSVVLHLHRDATWDAIAEADATLAATAMAMAERYGYHADPRYHPQVKGRLTPRQRWRARVVAIGDACVSVGGDVRMSRCQRR
jgi:hypothetical protein